MPCIAHKIKFLWASYASLSRCFDSDSIFETLKGVEVTCVAECSKKHTASVFRIQMEVRFVSLKQKSFRNVVNTAHVRKVSTTKNRANNNPVFFHTK